MNAAQVLSGPETRVYDNRFLRFQAERPEQDPGGLRGYPAGRYGALVDPEKPLVPVHGPGDMVLDILVDIGLAVEDHQVPVAKVAGQPFSGNPLYRRIAFSIRIDHGHFSHRKHGSVSTPWIRIYPLLNRR